MDREEPYTEEEIQARIREDEYHQYITTMTKTAVIEACDFVKEWNSKNGTMYTFKLSMSNGDKGTINTKSRTPDFLGEGMNLMYAVQKDEKFGDKFTRIKPQDPNTPSNGAFKAGQNFEDNPDRQRMIVRQSSLKAAIDYYNCFNDGNRPSPKDICTLAEEFTQYVMK